ncbi:MAG TPA: FAD-dependent monooxygenase [Verrucomicrobiae bacterium]|jgi:flavin-dependent dehydrogenase|nr:FAD-dependent monooxygenase [Verrucomicrobiae bacterium]
MSRPVTIIGGGLAGLTLGIGLRQGGVPVTIHESGDYPRHRVCGEFISGRGQTVLDRLGLLADFKNAGAVFARTAMFVSSSAESPVRALTAPALCLSRYKMDALLAAKFRELGGDLRVRSRWNGDADTLKRGNRTIDNEGVVSATGRRLQPTETETRWFGVKAHVGANPVNLEADLEMHISRDGYVGVNRIDDGQVNVCGLFRARPDKQRPESKMDWLLGQPDSPLRGRLQDAQFESQSFCSVAGIQLKPRRASTRDECSIGDALTMTPPVTGNGMSMAFESAEMAVEPITAYSRGEINWVEAKRQIAIRCDSAFSHRLAWARLLQWMMVAPRLQDGLGNFLLQSSWLWRFMFERTR